MAATRRAVAARPGAAPWGQALSVQPRYLPSAEARGVPSRGAGSAAHFSTRTSSHLPNPLDAFRDPVDRQTRAGETVGRSWSVGELRRKSYQDLHKLWYVLYKERNMLLTEQQLSRRRQLTFPQPERFQKVRKSMGAIKQVLGERKREKVADHLSRMEEAMMEESEAIDEDADDGSQPPR